MNRSNNKFAKFVAPAKTRNVCAQALFTKNGCPYLRVRSTGSYVNFVAGGKQRCYVYVTHWAQDPPVNKMLGTCNMREIPHFIAEYGRRRPRDIRATLKDVFGYEDTD